MADVAKSSEVQILHANPQRKTFKRLPMKKIPNEILEHPVLVAAREYFPKNYDFELPKTVWRILQLKAKRVAIQLPEGLSMFAVKISDVLEAATGVDVVILADVTYGACCVDDFTAKALNVDLLVHYGHSCLIPVDTMQNIEFLYVFVNIQIDVAHVEDTICFNFTADQKLAFVSTIQFITALHDVVGRLRTKGYDCLIPQRKPLSPGEILGCTAPTVPVDYIIVYLGDGRFHLEAAMIANPYSRYFRYDPYDKKLTEEFYDHKVMKEARKNAIDLTRNASKVGFILGTLGRQGSVSVLDHLRKYVDRKSAEDETKVSSTDYVMVLMSEVTPQKLNQFKDSIDAWIQIACPRLSIDWGVSFAKPLLTPYEAHVALAKKESCENELNSYPMDYYAQDSLGPWTPKHKPSLDKPKTLCANAPGGRCCSDQL